MAVGLGIAAVVVAVVSALIARAALRQSRRAADAAKTSAGAAEAADRRARTPQLAILLDQPGPGDRMIYRVRNDGPQDLDDVAVHRPRPPDRIDYYIATTGDFRGWQEQADLGAIAMTQQGRFTLSCGAAEELPEFRVRIVSRAGDDTWETVYLLQQPRGSGPT